MNTASRMAELKQLAYFEREIARHIDCGERIMETLEDGSIRVDVFNMQREYKTHIEAAANLIRLCSDIRKKLSLPSHVLADIMEQMKS